MASFGGPTREYQVRVDPNKLISYGLSIGQVEQQLTNNNTNAGGSFIESGLQQIDVREVGLVTNVHDIENTVLTTKTGTALKVKDIAVVEQGPKIRLGQFARARHLANGKIIDDDDVVSGIVLLRKGRRFGLGAGRDPRQGERAEHTAFFPTASRSCPFIDRSDLVHYTTHTVLHNLTEGIILVVIILFLFLGNVRGALIVALTIPFSLLFAATCLQLKGIPANLLSLGALDFGMVVDGAVVMVENIVRHLSRRAETDKRTPMEKIREAAHEVQRPVFYAIGIIITAYLPIFTLQRVEGRLFKPMAWTVAFALLGALMFSMLLAPVLSSLFFPKGTKEWHNPVMTFLTSVYRSGAGKAIRLALGDAGVALSGFALTIYLATSVLGSEFLPHLDEGAIWVRGITGAEHRARPKESRVANRARLILCSFPEVPQCTSQVGRPDDGTDTTGFFNTEYFVDLKPKEEWRPVFHQDKDELIAAMNRELEKIPGRDLGLLAADLRQHGGGGQRRQRRTGHQGLRHDLRTLEGKADEIMGVMRDDQGHSGSGIVPRHRAAESEPHGQPSESRPLSDQRRGRAGRGADRDRRQRADSGAAGRAALRSGAALSAAVPRPQGGDRKHPPAVAFGRARFAGAALRHPRCWTALRRFTARRTQRYVAIKYSVRGRDLGGAVEEAIAKVGKQVKLPRRLPHRLGRRV